MKFPSEYTTHFAISTSDNGYILYYEEEIVDLNARSNTSVVTKSRVYPETIEGKKELFEDMIELLDWFPAKRKDGLSIAVTKHEVF